MDKNILLTNIQRFSLHDGPGIRTTLFLKGCSLRCPWCSNPENLKSEPQLYIKDGKKGIYGSYYTCDELYAEIMKDKEFYIGEIEDFNIIDSDQIEKLPGGVTFSGGESLLQIDKLKPLLIRLKNEHIHTTVETCLFVSEKALEVALKLIDFFYVDMKILDKDECKEVIHGNLDLYCTNLKKLLLWKDDKGRHKPIVIRIPIIGTYTDADENRKAIINLLKQYENNILKIELIKEHNLAESKYKSLNMEISYHGVSDKLIDQYKKEMKNVMKIPVEICKI